MTFTHTIIVMFVGSFLTQYFLMSPIMVSKRIYITNNLGKLYISVIMAIFMLFLEVMMHDHQYNVLSAKFYIILIISLTVLIYLYRNQIGISDKQFLEEMIEHHSMGIFTSQEILKKTDSYEVTKLAKNIIQAQNDEIQFMQGLLAKNK